MKKIIPILVVGILVLSGLGAVAVTKNKATIDNHPPDIPKVAGVSHPKIGELYDYTFWTTDPDGDDVSYYVDWGDGDDSGWIGPVASGEPVEMVHAWYQSGNYLLRCKAKDHPYEAESDWFTCIIKVPPKNKATTSSLFLQFLERFMECFPLLERLLNIQG